MKKIIVLLWFSIFWTYVFCQNTDVQKYTISVDITDIASKSISGFTEIEFKPLNKTNSVEFFLEQLKIDSIIYKNMKVSFEQKKSTFRVNLSDELNDTIIYKIGVYYRGKPVKDSYWGGFYFSAIDAFNMGVGMQSVPPSFGRTWFPCNDDFTDKALYEFYIITDSKNMAVCNGTLVNVIPTRNNTIWNWKLNNPVSTYMVCVAVSDYVKFTGEYQGIEKKIPIEIFVHKNKEKFAKASVDIIKDALKVFESKFGAYQWEKAGYVGVSFNQGAMEHATMISFPESSLNGKGTYESLLVHELSHSWFGNLVTCKRAADMWLNEGWASYCEYIYNEFIYGKDVYKGNVRKNHQNVLQSAHLYDNGYHAVYNLPAEYTYGTTVYDKGADMVHTLRGYMGDSLFFETSKIFLEKNRFTNVSTNEFCKQFSQISNIDLNSFFDSWIYTPGFPHYEVKAFEVKKKDNKFVANVTVLQNFTGRSNYSHNNKVEIAFFDKNWNKTVETVQFSDIVYSFSKEFGTEPVFAFADIDEKLSDATTDEVKIVKTNGKQVFDCTYFSVEINNLKDSALIVGQLNWLKPDFLMKDYVAVNHYWKFDGIYSKNTEITGFFEYNTTNNFDNFSISTTTQLTLFYKENNASKWVKIPSEVIGTTSKGIISAQKLKKGFYTIAVANK